MKYEIGMLEWSRLGVPLVNQEQPTQRPVKSVVSDYRPLRVNLQSQHFSRESPLLKQVRTFAVMGAWVPISALYQAAIGYIPRLHLP